jgi:hypothetical protein
MKIDLKNCVLFIRRDTAAVTPPGNGNQGDFMLVKFGGGNFTYTIRRNFTYELDRGLLDDVRRGDEAPLDISFGGKYEYILSVPVTPSPSVSDLRNAYLNQLMLQEAMRGKILDGVTAHPWVTAGLEREPWLTCTPYCTALELHNDLRHECPETHVRGEALLFRYFRAEAVDHDVKAGTVAVTGKANILRPMALNPWCATPDEWPYTLNPGDVPIPFPKGDGTLMWPKDPRDPTA